MQGGTADLPRGPREPYRKYLRRLTTEGLTLEWRKQHRQYEKYGKKWDDYGRCCARRGERAYPTYLRLRAIAAEFRGRAAGR